MKIETIRRNLDRIIERRCSAGTGGSGYWVDLSDVREMLAPEPQPAPVRDEQDKHRPLIHWGKSGDIDHALCGSDSDETTRNAALVTCDRCATLLHPRPISQGGGGEQASEREPDAAAVRLANKTVNEWIGDSPSASMSGNAECKLRAGIAAVIDAALAEQRERIESGLRDCSAKWKSGVMFLSEAIEAVRASTSSTGAAPEQQRRVLGREREKA